MLDNHPLETPQSVTKNALAAGEFWEHSMVVSRGLIKIKNFVHELTTSHLKFLKLINC